MGGWRVGASATTAIKCASVSQFSLPRPSRCACSHWRSHRGALMTRMDPSRGTRRTDGAVPVVGCGGGKVTSASREGECSFRFPCVVAFLPPSPCALQRVSMAAWLIVTVMAAVTAQCCGKAKRPNSQPPFVCTITRVDARGDECTRNEGTREVRTIGRAASVALTTLCYALCVIRIRSRSSLCAPPLSLPRQSGLDGHG